MFKRRCSHCIGIYHTFSTLQSLFNNVKDVRETTTLVSILAEGTFVSVVAGCSTTARTILPQTDAKRGGRKYIDQLSNAQRMDHSSTIFT